MPVFDPTFTANKAAETLPPDVLNATGSDPEHRGRQLSAHSITGTIDARRKGRVKVAPPELDMFKNQKRVPIHIFNVGPFTHTIPCGSIGTFYIPGCVADKNGVKPEYVEMITPLYELQDEIYPKTKNGEAKRLYEEGRKMAVEILGEGRNQDRKQSRRRVGVFIAAGDSPTKKELHDANAELHAYASEQILYMDALWDRDRKLAYDVYRPETFGACARVLGLTGKEKGWLAQGEPANKVKCEGCHTPIDPEAPICFNCKSPANIEAYRAYRAKLKELDEPEKRGPGRPPKE
jgi:hypothetical protein